MKWKLFFFIGRATQLLSSHWKSGQKFAVSRISDRSGDRVFLHLVLDCLHRRSLLLTYLSWAFLGTFTFYTAFPCRILHVQWVTLSFLKTVALKEPSHSSTSQKFAQHLIHIARCQIHWKCTLPRLRLSSWLPCFFCSSVFWWWFRVSVVCRQKMADIQITLLVACAWQNHELSCSMG